MLMPRLLAVSIFLTLFSATVFFAKKKSLTDFSIFRNPVFILLALYLVVVIASSFFALNTREGYFDIVRTIVFFVLVFYWVQLSLSTPAWFDVISKMVIISSLIAAAVGFYQYFGQVLGGSENTLADGRELLYVVDGLMAHKNFFASSLMLMLPFLIWGVWKLREKWRIAAIGTTALVFILIIIVATRAVWVAIIVSFIVVSVILLVYNRHFQISKKNIRNFAIIASVSILIVFTFIAVGGRISKNAYLEKLASVVRPAERNNHFRLDIWNITLDMAKDHPVTGVGAGNWQIMVPEYYNKIKLKGKEVNWQTPHNDFLWILSEKGFPGLLLYLGVMAMLAFFVFRIITGNGVQEKKIMAVLLFAGLMAYLGNSFFDFPYQRIDHQLYLSIFIAGIVGIYHQQKPAKQLAFSKTIFGVCLTIFLLFGVVYSYAALQLEIHSKKAMFLHKSGKDDLALNEIKLAETPFRSLDAMGSPLEYYSGLSYSSLNKHQEAIPYFLKAIELHPNHIALLNNIGLAYYKTGNNELAKKYYLDALKIVPDYKEALVNLSSIYYFEKNYNKSLEMLEDVKGKKKLPEIKKNINALNKILGIPADSLDKAKKHKDKQTKKAEKAKKHKKDKDKAKRKSKQ